MASKKIASEIQVLETETDIVNNIWGDKFRQIHYTIKSLTDWDIEVRVYTGVDGPQFRQPLLADDVDYPDDKVWLQQGPIYIVPANEVVDISIIKVQSHIKLTGRIMIERGRTPGSEFGAVPFNSSEEGQIDIWVTHAL